MLQVLKESFRITIHNRIVKSIDVEIVGNRSSTRRKSPIHIELCESMTYPITGFGLSLS